MNHQFIVMWDCNGLEVCCDVTQAQQRTVWEKLRGELPSESGIPSLGHLKLRAQYNSQRHYEIYIVEAQEGITADDIREMFEANPQTAADTIRQLGTCFHSDRATTKPVIV
jgi:hypothetical protein